MAYSQEVSMDLQQMRLIAPQIDAEIKAVFEKHGLRVSGRKAINDEHTGILKWNLTLADTNLKDKSGNTTTPEAERWQVYHEIYGLPKDGVGRIFESGGKPYKIVGMKAGRSRKSLVAQQTWNHKRYVF